MKRNIFIILGIFLSAILMSVGIFAFLSDKKIMSDNKDKIKEFVKENMNSAWHYAESKIIIDDEFNTTINLNNVNNIVECYDSSLIFANDLLSSYSNDIKINSLTFACKSENDYENTGYIEIRNVEDKNLTDYNLKVYDENKNIVIESLDTYREKIKNEYIANCQKYDYKEIFRNSEKYVGKQAKFTGEVIQVLEEDGYYTIRMNVTKDAYGYYSNTMAVGMETKVIQGRILENDIITVYGELTELIKYESIFGETITIPGISAKYAELVN